MESTQSLCGYISSPDIVFISLWWYLSQLCNVRLMVSADELHVPVYTPNCIVKDIVDDCGV